MTQFSKDNILSLFADYRIIPVFYSADLDYTRSVCKACYDGGIRIFEFTNRGEDAQAVFAALLPFVREHCPGMALGIGTILTVQAAETFLDLGADFVVQPFITPAVATLCEQRDSVWIPAGATLNEINNAILLGAGLVKVFPASVLGPGFIKAILGPMPCLNLMATGGVLPNRENLSEWFSAGIGCVGIGSQLFAGINGLPDALRDRVTPLMAHCQTFKRQLA